MARLCSKKAIDEVLPQRLCGWEGAPGRAGELVTKPSTGVCLPGHT